MFGHAELAHDQTRTEARDNDRNSKTVRIRIIMITSLGSATRMAVSKCSMINRELALPGPGAPGDSNQRPLMYTCAAQSKQRPQGSCLLQRWGRGRLLSRRELLRQGPVVGSQIRSFVSRTQLASGGTSSTIAQRLRVPASRLPSHSPSDCLKRIRGSRRCPFRCMLFQSTESRTCR